MHVSQSIIASLETEGQPLVVEAEQMQSRADEIFQDPDFFQIPVHIALGGGESFCLDWLFVIARYIRDKGMVPNITTNGTFIDEESASACSVFGQINVSLDGVGDFFEKTKGRAGFDEADRALGPLERLAAWNLVHLSRRQ